MAVGRAGVGYTQSYLLGPDANGSKSFNINVNPAATNTYGIVTYGITGDSDIDGATLGVTWDGEAMVSLFDPLYFDTDNSVLRAWIIEAPNSGAVLATYADLPFGLFTKNLFLAAAVFSSVEPLDLDTVDASVVTAVGVGAVSTSGVTVPSTVAADRVISGHLIGQLRAFTVFSGTKVAAPILAGGGQMILGESRGSASTVVTATHNASSSKWAAWGLNLDALPIEGLGFQSSITIPAGSFGAGLYRFATPHPDRDYTVPGMYTSDPNVLANGVTLRNANGVDMPVWVKDPDSVLDYTFRWHNHLAPDDELVRVEHVPSGSLQIISEAVNPDDASMTQFWTKGGTPGINHEVMVRLWTRKGRQDDFTCFIQCENN